MGIIWGLYIKFSIAPIFIFILILGIIYLRIGKYRRILNVFSKIITIFAIACVLGNLYIIKSNNEYERVYKQGTKFTEYAVVVSEEKQTEYKKEYQIRVSGNSGLKNKKFILRISKNSNFNLQFGDLIKINGEYTKPSVQRNYGGFDYSNYLKSKQIYGIVNSQNLTMFKSNQVDIVSNGINSVRNFIIDRAKKIIKEENASGLLIGFLIGNTSFAQEEVIQNFKDSSLAHMLAVSGQHVGYVILAIGFALKICNIGKREGKILSIVILFIFMLITGLTPSVFRAGTMGILMILSGVVYRKADIYNDIAISMLLILICNPFYVYDVGLWLSYRRGAWNYNI